MSTTYIKVDTGDGEVIICAANKTNGVLDFVSLDPVQLKDYTEADLIHKFNSIAKEVKGTKLYQLEDIIDIAQTDDYTVEIDYDQDYEDAPDDDIPVDMFMNRFK